MRWEAMRGAAILLAVAPIVVPAALARPAFSCGGFAMLGGAQMICSHTDSTAPAQMCTFSWSLMSTGAGQTMVNGSFLLVPGLTNATVYQGSGFAYALSAPIVLCQGRRTGR